MHEANVLHHPAPPAAPRATRRATAPTSYHQQHQHRPRRQQHHEHGQRRGGRELIDIPQRSGTPYRTGTAWAPPKLRTAAYTALQGQHLRAARITRAVVPYFSQSDSNGSHILSSISEAGPGGSNAPRSCFCPSPVPAAGGGCAPYENTRAKNRRRSNAADLRIPPAEREGKC